MKKILPLIILALIITSLLPSPEVYAQNTVNELFGTVRPPEAVNTLPGTTGAEKIGSLLNRIISVIYIFGATALIIMLLWGAVQWITSGGSKEGIAAAKGRIVYALIGFVLLALAWLIVAIVGTLTGTRNLFPFFPQSGRASCGASQIWDGTRCVRTGVED